MQANIPSNIHANTEQARLAPRKYNTKYYRDAITVNLSNKYNHLQNDMITFLQC